MKLNIVLYLKVDFLGTGWVYKRPITGTEKETHMDMLLLLISSYDPYASTSFTSVDKPQVNPQEV